MSGRTAGVLALAVGLGACTVAGPRPGRAAEPVGAVSLPSGVEPGIEPSVRVGVAVGADSVRIGGTGAFEAVDEGGRVRARGEASSTWVVRRSGAGVVVTGPGTPLRSGGVLVVRPSGGSRLVVDGRPYRGTLLVRAAAQGVTVANALDLESYLLGVVPLEIGAGRPPEEAEAVKAQAVAARTYAIRNMGRHGDQGFDFVATIMDQVYGGQAAEDPVATQAVRKTRGEIVVYGGEPILALYHSTCGERTAAINEVWPVPPEPYLRSVSDRRPGGGWYGEGSSRFRWTEEWDADQLAADLTAGLQETGRTRGRVTRVDDIEITRRTTSGRVGEMRIRTNLGETVVHGDSVRWILRPEPGRILNSALIFDMETEGRAEITHLTVHGGGWGHGIGMCQIGAVGRARAGQSYREILGTYYPGTRIARLYK